MLATWVDINGAEMVTIKGVDKQIQSYTQSNSLNFIKSLAKLLPHLYMFIENP